MIQAVIFDWGGVLIEDPAPGLMNYCAGHLGVTEGEFQAAFARFGPDLQTGMIAESVLWERVCAALHPAVPDVPSLWGRAFRAIYRPRIAMFDLAVSLRRQGLKTALLSNTEAVVRDYFHEQRYSMFDVQVFSCDEGMAKPAPAIYERTLARLNVPAAGAVFLDDRPEFVEGACQVGLHGIHFQGTQPCLATLRSLGLDV
jgi:putative hydrolase of the HAD superfamily